MFFFIQFFFPRCQYTFIFLKIVLKAEYKTSKIVAVKKMKPGSKEDEFNFSKEAEFMMKLQNLQDLQHRNVVQFYGVSKDNDCSILIVTEYVKYGKNI